MRSLRIASLTAFILAGSLALTGCSVNADSAKTDKAEDKNGVKTLEIVATTGYLADAITNIDPEAKITTLVKPGGDPHTQELSTKDTEAIEQADLVIWTSHDMEHKMMNHFDGLGDKSYAPGDFLDKEKELLPWEEDGKVEGHDPHIWNSPDNWKHVVTLISERLAKANPAKADTYKSNAEKYNQKIEALKQEAQAKFATIPAEHRYLVTGHDAFQYLGHSFGLTVLATDVVSSEGDKSDKDIEELAQQIADHKIKTIFVDNLKSPKAIQSLKEKVAAHGWEVTVSDEELYADTLSESGAASTYLGAFKHNCDVITAGLGAK